uniref:Uncharacterized protein n=1 Tax=Bornetia secundiflora TaxID=2575637 RepID=A0A4D6WLS7_9FLOR|nr:hypothetical protein [Bornetia secundiflora]
MNISTNNNLFAYQASLLYQIKKKTEPETKIIQKIYLIQCNQYLSNQFRLYKRLIDRYNANISIFFNKLFYDKYISLLKTSGFLKSLISFNTYIDRSKYIIFYIELNPILKKIRVVDYHTLSIPKKNLLKYLNYQIGLPINYKSLNNSLYNIHKWYVNQGFKWVKIHYYIKNNQINIFINEGSISDILLINSYRNNFHKSVSNKYINKLNQLIINELNLCHNQKINLYKLEIDILKLKHKYIFHNIQYFIKNTGNRLSITIAYNIYDHKTYLIKWHNMISIYKECVSSQVHLFYTLNQAITKYSFKIAYFFIQYYTQSLFNIPLNDYIIIHENIIKIYKRCNLYLHIYYSQYFIKVVLLIIPKQLHATMFINIMINIYIYYHILQTNHYYYLNHKFIPCTNLHSYIYKAHLKICNLEIKYKNLIYQEFIVHYDQYFQKYINLLHYLNYDQLINIIKIHQFKVFQYNINYNNLPLVNLSITNIRHIVNIYYKALFYLPEIINKQLYFKYSYFHHIQIKYQKLYLLNRMILGYHKLLIYSELNILIGHIAKYLMYTENLYNKVYTCIVNHKYHALMKLEYQLLFSGSNHIYLFSQYLPFKNIYNYYSLEIINLKNIKPLSIQVGIGIQINIPLKYIPIIRLESNIKTLHNAIIKTYLMSKLY